MGGLMRTGGAILAGTAVALWAIVAIQARGDEPEPALVLGAGTLTLVAAAWPFVHGWRPFRPSFVTCPACATLLRRAEAPMGLCPACMGA